MEIQMIKFEILIHDIYLYNMKKFSSEIYEYRFYIQDILYLNKYIFYCVHSN